MQLFGDNGIITQAQKAVQMQSVAVLQEFLNQEYVNLKTKDWISEEGFTVDEYESQVEVLKTAHPEWFFQNMQGYVLDSYGHVLYLINKQGLPEEIKKSLHGGEAIKVSDFYGQKDVFGCTSDLYCFYCLDGIDSIIGLTLDDLKMDSPFEVAYETDSNLAKLINGVDENGNAIKSLTYRDLKTVRELTIDNEDMLTVLSEFSKLNALKKVFFNGINISTLKGIDGAQNIEELKFVDCNCSDYKAISNLTNLNKLYLVRPKGGDTEINSILCSGEKGIKDAELSNLEYFGIVGYDYYIQSLSKEYSQNFDENITDISGLAQLNSVTKEAVKYLYLMCNGLTSLCGIEDFVNVEVLRCEDNKLDTLEGIQNMSKLTYLIAGDQRKWISNLNRYEYYFAAHEDISLQNPLEDALSYIYKDENGKNDSLYFVALQESAKLKWVSYLHNCTSLEYLYLDNSGNIQDISTIAKEIGQCGENYILANGYGKAIISNQSSLLNLGGITLTKSEFMELQDSTTLKYLSLANTKITNNDGSEMTDAEYQELFNTVLLGCTSMRYLQLLGQTRLTSINFVSNMNDLKELDLYGCTGISDLSILETMTNRAIETYNLLKKDESGEPIEEIQPTDDANFKLGFLNITNSNINLKAIEKTISRLGDTASYWHCATGGGKTGLGLGSVDLIPKLEACTGITRLVMHRSWTNLYYVGNIAESTVNLTGCVNLKELKVWGYRQLTFILPANIEIVDFGYHIPAADLSLCTKIKNLVFQDVMEASTVETMINSLPNTVTSVESIVFLSEKETTFSDLNFLSKLQNCTNFDTFSLKQHSNGWLTISDLTGLSYLKYAKTIEIIASPRYHLTVNKFPDFSNSTRLENVIFSDCDIINLENIPKMITVKSLNLSGNIGTKILDTDLFKKLSLLEYLDLSNNTITDLTGISELLNLETLILNSNRISDIRPLIKLKNLKTLYLEDNALQDMSTGLDGSTYYTLSYFIELNKSQEGNLENLYLENNFIDDFSALKDSNLVWEETSGF